MSELDLGKVAITDMTGAVSNFSVDSTKIDQVGANKNYCYAFPDAPIHLDYYKTIPEYKKAVDALTNWVTSKGINCDGKTLNKLSVVIGNGSECYQQVFENWDKMGTSHGDSFIEIMRDEDTGGLLNLKNLYTGDMRVYFLNNGMIDYYEYKRADGTYERLEKHQVMHLCIDKIGNEVHGTAAVDACKWVIDARNEVLRDYRKVLHRNVVPVRIIEVDTENTAKRDALIREYEQAINLGEVLVVPKGTVTITDSSITIQDPTTFIQYLENFFYQAVGIPKVIAASQDYSEASSKVGFLTFEPVYTRRQLILEAIIYRKLGFVVKFNRPPSLSGMMQESEDKNTGQTGFQPSDVVAGVQRTE